MSDSVNPPQPPAEDVAPTPQFRTIQMEGRIGNAFACERCRKHKVRCVPSDVAGICQRCQKARVECVEHIARRRPAKPRSVVGGGHRMAEMEKKIDKLSAIVTATTAPQSTIPPASLPPVSTLPSQFSPVLAQRTPTPASTGAASLTAPASTSVPKPPPLLPNPSPAPESAVSFWDSINETISGLGRLDPVLQSISVIHMQLLLESYRSMTDYFPFVVLAKESFCRDLLQQRPMLMFAILTVASYDSALLQLTLSREFRKVVMVKVMNGEKSLDLLQGLLVFIAWHHHYTDPQAVSIHMLLQLCIGMAGDLGLDRIPSPSRDLRNHESKRAYLGCYYLTCNLSIIEGGSGYMSYSDVHRDYAAELAHSSNYRSDIILPFLVETCYFLEDVHETTRNTRDGSLSTKFQIKRLAEKWDNLRISSQSWTSEFKVLQWNQLAARVYLYREGLGDHIWNRDSSPWIPGFLLSLRITCVRSIEQFLDNSVQLVSSQFEFLTLVDWIHLISTLTTLGRLALHSLPMHGWDPVELQLSKTFEHFRDRLCAQMPRSLDNQERKVEDVFDRFRRITATMKMTIRNVPGRQSPNGSTFEITTSSRGAVSILQDAPPKPNGAPNGVDLPSPWKVNPAFDMSNAEFSWKFLMGAL